MPVPTGRTEKRIARAVAVEVYLPTVATLEERTRTENVSLHGARVLTEREWGPGQKVTVFFPSEGVWARGDIVYCQRLSERKFAAGLELSVRLDQWAKLS